MEIYWCCEKCHEAVSNGNLKGLEVNERGEPRYMAMMDDNIFAIMWVDRERGYFVGNEPQYRIRWRQLEDVETNAEPERQELKVISPVMVQTYYDGANAIDCHNRQRQDDLEMERIIKTKSWDKRVGMSIFAMVVVDTCNFHQSCSNDVDDSPHSFYTALAGEMIDNDFDRINLRSRSSSDRTPVRSARAGGLLQPSPHLTPTKEKRLNKNGNATPYSRQGHCRICRTNTTYQCSLCIETKPTPKPWFCHYKNGGRNCFEQHLEAYHDGNNF